MRRDMKNAFESWLVGELWLVLLLGSAAALFLTSPVLRHTYFRPRGPARAGHRRRARGHGRRDPRGGALLRGGRRPLDLLLAAGFFTAGVGTLAFSVVPVLGGAEQGAPEAWAAVVSRVLAATFIAAAPLVPERRVAAGARALVTGAALSLAALAAIWSALHARGDRLGPLDPSGDGDAAPSSPWRWPSSPSSPSSP